MHNSGSFTQSRGGERKTLKVLNEMEEFSKQHFIRANPDDKALYWLLGYKDEAFAGYKRAFEERGGSYRGSRWTRQILSCAQTRESWTCCGAQAFYSERKTMRGSSSNALFNSMKR